MKISNEVTTQELKRRTKTKGKPRFKRSAPVERTEDGITFASKAELKRYRELRALRKKGIVAWFLRQPRFDLAGATYTADFLIVWKRPSSDGSIVTVEEVKPQGLREPFRSEATRAWIRNARQVETLYGIKITLIEK